MHLKLSSKLLYKNWRHQNLNKYKNCFLLFLSLSSLHGVEINEWRTITFGAPSIDFVFKIDSGGLGRIKKDDKHFSWNGKPNPSYSCITMNGTDFKDWHTGTCSMKTLEFAYQLSDKKNGQKVDPDDREMLNRNMKYIFTVYNDTNNRHEPSYEGYVTEDEFITLMTMLHNDLESKTRSTPTSVQSNNFQSLLNEKIQALK